MKNFKSIEMKTAYEHGGFRERYAMEHGNKQKVFMNGKEFWKFTYSPHKEYQDANGALYDVTRKEWCG